MHEPLGTPAFRARIVSRARDWQQRAPLHAFGGRPLLEAPLPVSARSRRPFHLTLDLDLADPRLAGLGVTSVRRLALLACFHVEYQPGAPLLVRHHDAGRRLEILREPRGRLVENLPLELPQLPVELEPLNEAEAAIETLDELPDDSAPLHVVGGHPIWARKPLPAPACPVSGEPMRYVGMIDSIRRFPIGDGDIPLMFGDGGAACVFWSDTASISASIIQLR